MLHEAAATRSPEVIEYLITNGAQVNVADKYGHTPLDVATVFGTAEVAALLEQAGATHGEGLRIKAAPTDTGDNPLQPQEVNNYWVDSFLYAAREGDIETVAFLLDHGEDIEARDSYGMTALLSAVSEGHTDTVKLLLDRDADIEAQARNGMTALLSAATDVSPYRDGSAVAGHIEIVALLLDRGANIENEDSFFEWMLMMKAARA